MTDDERLHEALRRALGRTTPSGPSRDLWPLIVGRSRTTPGWSWLDLALAAMVVALLLIRPEWLGLLAFHL